MRVSNLVFYSSAVLVGVTQATPIAEYGNKHNSTLRWQPCNITGATLPMDCAKLAVPLDYTNKSSLETIDLNLQRVRTSKGKASRGSIIFNFGGPGSVGFASLAPFGKILSAITGGEHDLITFDPRGTGKTLPFTCFDDDFNRLVANKAQTGLSSDIAMPEIWAKSTIYDNSCYNKQNATGSFIGTAFVARDMMEIVNALNEDGLLRYWGVSYGTVLGATVAAMFPDKMDKIILDGVVNVPDYYENREIEMWTSADAVFQGFCQACVAHRDSCKLAGNYTGQQLESYILRELESLRHNPLPIPAPGYPGGGILLDYSVVKSFMHSGLYNPLGWPALSKKLHGVITRNLTELAEATANVEDGGEDTRGYQEAMAGVKCSDVRIHADNLTSIMPTLRGRHSRSKVFGDIADVVVARCAQWSMPAKEIYQGDFKVKSKNPVLFIGNTYDPTTPLIAAKKMSKLFKGSAVLEQKSYGHVSLSQASICTAKTIKSYILGGKLPEDGNFCDIDAVMWSGKDGWIEILDQI